jgi:hypothetical protein
LSSKKSANFKFYLYLPLECLFLASSFSTKEMRKMPDRGRLKLEVRMVEVGAID